MDWGAGGTMLATVVVTTSTAVLGASIPDGPVEDGADLGRCIVRLHGAGGSGQQTAVWGGIADVFPDGNAELTDGGRMWDYDPEARYEEARTVIEDAAAACDEIMLHGFSNGGGFAATVFCRGEDFEGRLLQVVIDDPVTDHGVEGCDPSSEVDVVLYWTGALDPGEVSGADCSMFEYTCLGGTLLSIDDYAAALGVAAQPSIYSEHRPHWYAPELADWSRASSDSTLASGPATTDA
jgi:hypothetical protein